VLACLTSPSVQQNEYAYSAKLLLFACSCASSDLASLPLR
jgi:hypothetical protein